MIEFKDRKVSRYTKKGKKYPLIQLPSCFERLIGKKYKITVIDENKILIEFY